MSFGGGENDLSEDGPGDIAADVFHDNATELQQDTTVGNNNEQATAVSGIDDEGVMPLPPTIDVSAALKKARSTVKVSKMKNSSNNNKDRTSIAGAIVKLIENQNQTPSSNIAASATIMLMRQLERMNKSMDERERQEKMDKKKERKHCMKQRAKKKAKRKAKKAKRAKKRAALKSLDDHGGKARGGYSSSSSSSSSFSSSSNDSDSNSRNSDSGNSNDSNQSSDYGRGKWRRAGKGIVEG